MVNTNLSAEQSMNAQLRQQLLDAGSPPSAAGAGGAFSAETFQVKLKDFVHKICNFLMRKYKFQIHQEVHSLRREVEVFREANAKLMDRWVNKIQKIHTFFKCCYW
jgi:hypothetical protein